MINLLLWKVILIWIQQWIMKHKSHYYKEKNKKLKPVQYFEMIIEILLLFLFLNAAF